MGSIELELLLTVRNVEIKGKIFSELSNINLILNPTDKT